MEGSGVREDKDSVSEKKLTENYLNMYW